MRKEVKNLKVCWVPILAMALTVSIVSCHNEKVAEKKTQEIYRSNFSSFEDSFEKSRFLLEHYELEDVIDSDETTNEAGFSR
ncbi:MAG: hypothetical protein IKF71_03960 [Bacilli bacterium]|nr:hypothetical protein [Bacilli bacterium]